MSPPLPAAYAALDWPGVPPPVADETQDEVPYAHQSGFAGDFGLSTVQRARDVDSKQSGLEMQQMQTSLSHQGRHPGDVN